MSAIRSIRRASLIAAVAGLPLAASATVFTFSGSCGSNWSQACNTGVPCGGGQNIWANNWGFSGCGGGLSYPGAADDATWGAITVVVNSSVTVNSISFSAGGGLDWQAGDLTVATTLNNVGSFGVNNGHKTLFATVLNNGTMTLHSGWNLSFAQPVTNQGTLALMDKQVFASGTGSITNTSTGTIVKSTGGTVYVQGVPVSQQGQLNVTGGTLTFNGLSFASTASASYQTPGGNLGFDNCTLSGIFSGTATGGMSMNSSASLSGPTTLNIGGNGFTWASGDLTTAANTLTNTGILNIPTSHRSMIGGSLTNSGTINMSNSWNLTFVDTAVTNTGLIHITDKTIYGGGTATLTNNGTLRKSTGPQDDIYTLTTYQNSAVEVLDGSLHFHASSIVSGAGSTYTTNGGGFWMDNCTVRGTFAGPNTSGIGFYNAVALSGDTNLNITLNPLVWSSGDLTTNGYTLNNYGLMQIPHSHRNMLGGVLANHGTLSLINSWNWTLADGAILRNLGTIDLWDKTILVGTGGGTIENQGLLRKVDAPQDDITGVTMLQSGMVRVEAGSLHLHSLALTNDSDALYNVTGSFWMDGCTVRGTFNATNTGAFGIYNGMTLAADTTFNVSGTHAVWSSGDIQCGGFTLRNTGNMTIPSNHRTLIGRMENTGNLRMENSWNLYVNGDLVNETGGTISMLDKDVIGVGAAKIINRGTFTKATTVGDDIYSLRFEHVNAMNVTQGSLVMHGVHLLASPSSTTTVSAGATMWLDGCTVEGRLGVSNSGTMGMYNGMTLAGNMVLACSGTPAVWSSGNIQCGAHTFTNSGGMVISSNHKSVVGNMRNTGTVWLQDGWNQGVSSGTLENFGTIEFVNKTVLGSSASILNSGTIRFGVAASNSLNDLPITNTGAIRVQAGTATFTNSPITQTTTGSISVDPGTALSTNTGLNLAAGSLICGGTINGNVTSTGAVTYPSAAVGTMRVNGSFTHINNAVMSVDLGGIGAGESDRLSIQNAAALGGKVVFNFTNGYIPTPGDVITFLTTDSANNVSGTFASFSMINNPYGVAAQLIYAHNLVSVHIFACEPCTPCNGDYNQDGGADTSDIIDLANDIASGVISFPGSNPDFNLDGGGDTSDVLALSDFISSSSCP